MRSRDLSNWIWGDALSLLEQAERLQQRFLQVATQGRGWVPPIDILEDDESLVVTVALPGVPAAAVQVELLDDALRICGLRANAAGRCTRIHRLEIPYGRFERRIALPLHALGPAQHQMLDGCLWIRFPKKRELT